MHMLLLCVLANRTDYLYLAHVKIRNLCYKQIVWIIEKRSDDLFFSENKTRCLSPFKNSFFVRKPIGSIYQT